MANPFTQTWNQRRDSHITPPPLPTAAKKQQHIVHMPRKVLIKMSNPINDGVLFGIGLILAPIVLACILFLIFVFITGGSLYMFHG